MTLPRGTAKNTIQNKGSGQRNTASSSEASGPQDPRWRRVQQESTIRPIIGGGLNFSNDGVLEVARIPRQAELSSTATNAEIVTALNALNKQLREKGYQT